MVFKFGGASVQSAQAVRNIASIMDQYPEKVIIVVSAMGKTTNVLENLVTAYFKGADTSTIFSELQTYHINIATGLLPNLHHFVYTQLDAIWQHMAHKLSVPPSLNFDYEYDQLVSMGEVLSTIIVSAYLNDVGIENQWVDIRPLLRTDSTFREAKIDWDISKKRIAEAFNFNKSRKFVTQGFIGSDMNNAVTTLGREGSDYTAAILSYMLDAQKMVVWKDVPGVLNADPKYFDDTVKLEKLSYLDAIELTFYGATIIHPKTIKPLQNKNILMQVKSFVDPSAEGTLIGNFNYTTLIPCFIFKVNQVLINVSPLDFSFIDDEKLEKIIGVFAKNRIRINLMQNSAISLQLCVSNEPERINNLLVELGTQYTITCRENLELITIRYYDKATIDRVMKNKELLIEQKSKTTIQMVVQECS